MFKWTRLLFWANGGWEGEGKGSEEEWEVGKWFFGRIKDKPRQFEVKIVFLDVFRFFFTFKKVKTRAETSTLQKLLQNTS